MKRFVLLLALAIIAIAIYSCRKDVTITPPPSLSGDYEGLYIFKRGNTPADTLCLKQMRFTQDEFSMVWDEDLCPSENPSSCPARGGYRLEANLTLFAINALDTNYQSFQCDRSHHPYATYVIDQSVKDEVLLESLTGSGESAFYRRFELQVIK